MIEGQAYYGGRGINRSGGQEGDYLCHTDALAKFTVIVEIKRPDTSLFGRESYRNGAWELHTELTGGMTQLQVNCRTWNISGSRQPENQERLLRDGIHTVEPEGILIIGHSAQYAENMDKRNTFETFRRNLRTPRVITFDELFERAKFIVNQPAQPSAESRSTSTVSGSVQSD